jgi:aminopeptidase N
MSLAMASGACASTADQAATADASASTSWRVRHVTLDLNLDFKRRQAEGVAHLDLSAPLGAAPIEVVLDAAFMTIHDVRGQVRGQMRSAAAPTTLRFEHAGGNTPGNLRVWLAQAPHPGQTVQLSIRYRTQHQNHSDPNLLGGSTGLGIRWLAPNASDLRKPRQAWTSGEPDSARHIYPGLHGPEQRHTSTVHLTVPQGLTAYATGVRAQHRPAITPQAPQQQRLSFHSARPHPPQRLLFAVGQFQAIEQARPGLVTVSAGLPQEAKAVAESTRSVLPTLRYFEQLTGQPFPGAPRRGGPAAYAQVFVADLPWGHSGPGLAINTENMIDDAGTHADFHYLWNLLQAEMLAQQWFGNRVAASTWQDQWLDRAWPLYLAALDSEQRSGRAEMQLWVMLSHQRQTLGDFAAGQGQPVVKPGARADDAWLASSGPYQRGAAVLHLLRHELGEPAWRQLLRAWAAQGESSTSALQALASRLAGRSLEGFFSQWTERSDHPVFEISHEHDAQLGQVALHVRQVQAGAPFFGRVQVDVTGRVHSVLLRPLREQTFKLPASAPPAWVQFDHGGHWLKEVRHTRSPAQWLAMYRHSRDALDRQIALEGLEALAADETQQPPVLAALREAALERTRWWRERFNALQSLRRLHARQAPDALTEQVAQQVLAETGPIAGTRTWLRAAALQLLSTTRRADLAPLYIAHLRDPSDRVINAAAQALGQSKSALAFEALTALPAHPSWKQQSLISALNGLRELGDARAVPLALQALADVQLPRWTLSTPVWNTHFIACDTLLALGAADQGLPIVLKRLEAALAEGDVNDIFSAADLAVRLGQPQAAAVFAPLRQRFAGDAALLAAVDALQARLNTALAKR